MLKYNNTEVSRLWYDIQYSVVIFTKLQASTRLIPSHVYGGMESLKF